MYPPDYICPMTYRDLKEALRGPFSTSVAPVAIDDGLHGVLVYGIGGGLYDDVLIGDG